MNLTGKRIAMATAAAAAIAVGAGAAWAIAESDERISDEQRDRVSQVAIDEVGGGRVLETDADDENGERRYEVEVVDDDGRQWDVVIDENYAVLASRLDDDSLQPTRAPEPADAPISAEERDRVAAVAAGAVAGGRTIDVDRSDDAGEAWDVEVVDDQGQDWDVTLDAELKVLSVTRD